MLSQSDSYVMLAIGKHSCFANIAKRKGGDDSAGKYDERVF